LKPRPLSKKIEQPLKNSLKLLRCSVLIAMKLITDANLGKLAKWLRILGYDTLYYKGLADREFLRKAQREGRIALTRKKDLASRQFSGRLVLIESDRVREQLAEVMDNLSLQPDPDLLLSICLKCNEKLRDIGKEEVRGLVPAYVFEQQARFHICPHCGRVYWPGTHKNRLLGFLEKKG
jgi:uncharacterized protein with PIN domain